VPADMDDYHGWRWLPKGHCHCHIRPEGERDVSPWTIRQADTVKAHMDDDNDATAALQNIVELALAADYLLDSYRIQIVRRDNVVSRLAGRQGRAICCVNGALAGTGVSPAKDVEDIARVVRELVARIK